MKGRIERIKLITYSDNEFGFIAGEDGNSYYFDNRSIPKGQTTRDFYEDDIVEFDVVVQPERDKNMAANMKLFEKPVQTATKGDEHNISTVVEVAEDAIEIAEATQTPIKFYKKGFFRHIDKKKMYAEHLKPDSGEKQVLEKLSKLLYVTHIGHHDVGHGVIYPFCLLGATSLLKQYIRGQYEFLLIFSHFDNESWQQNTVKAAHHIRHRKEIAERRPLVNFYVLVSNAKTLKYEIDKMKGGTSAAIIPFSFEELLACDSTEAMSKIILSRFDEYLFENNMLGQENPIEEDTLLFGDRGKIADSIVQRCAENKCSGIFGLRRSGKSSVLRAVERRLIQNGIKYTKIEARSELETIDSWKTALYDIARKVRIAATGIEQKDGESRSEYNARLKLSCTEEDYMRRPTQCFVEDVKLYTKDESAFVIAIDEVELITYNTATSSMWQDLDSYKGFWSALRDSEIALIICGVNSTINEKSTIVFKGKSCDNPMYERIHNCAGFSKTYLPAFTDEQTGVMINTLGSYSNIGFNNIYVDINRAFGGQPYAIRQFCAYVFDNVKEHRTTGRIYQVSKPTFMALLQKFNNSSKGVQLFNTILQHIQIYSDEYDELKNLALESEKHRIITPDNTTSIDHLEKYGLIEYDRSTHFVTFNIASIREFICKYATKKPEQMTNDERRQYVQDRVKTCEEKLKEYLLNIFTYNKTLNPRNILKGYIASKKITVNLKANPTPNENTCHIRDFFNHKLFIMYFSTLKIIIKDKWSVCEYDFMACGISKENFSTYMDDLNAGRTDADHYDPQNSSSCPNDWEINDTVLQSFISAYNKMETFFAAMGL